MINSRRLPSHSFIAALLVAGLSFALPAWAPPAQADTSPVPATLPATVSADALPTWQVTGVVLSQVTVGTTVYATGKFSRARPFGVSAGGAGEITVGHLIAYDIRTGERLPGFNHILSDQGLSIAAAPDGTRIYVGGDFTTVDGQPRAHIAAFNTADGKLVSSFAPVLDQQVKALAVSSTTVYAGGAFTAISTTPVTRRRFLAAFSASNGAVTGWAPSGADGYAWGITLTPDKTKVVVGGQFKNLNGAVVNGMVATDATTGASRPWLANKTIVDHTRGAINSLTTDGTYVYGSGFAFGTGGVFEGSFALNPLDGSIRWLLDCHGDTYDVEPVGQVVYSVSHAHDCTMINAFPDTNPRTRWQHALATTSYPTGTNNGPDSYGWNYKGQPAPTLLHWYPDLGIGQATGQSQAAWSATSGAGFLALGGEFPSVNGKAQQGLTRFALAMSAPNKVGPRYDGTAPVRSSAPATTATVSGGTVALTYGTAWDYDNQRLTYRVYRDRGSANETLISTFSADSNFWTVPSRSLTDAAVPAGRHSYQVKITDPAGNELLSPISNEISVTAPNTPPVASFTQTLGGSTANFDGRNSTDTDGSIASYAWDFGDTGSATGATATHTYAAAGSYLVKLTVTDDRGSSASIAHVVTVTDSAALAKDTFGRTVAGGWGAAETGGTWATTGAGFSVTNGGGLLNLGPGASGSARLPLTSTGSDLTFDLSFDRLAGGGGQYVYATARGDASNGYLAKLGVDGAGGMNLTMVRVEQGLETVLSTAPLVGTLTPDRRLTVRVQAFGAAPTTLRAKVFAVTDAEPTAWALTAVDARPSLQQQGGIAVKGYVSRTATDPPVTITFDNLRATTVQG